MSCKYTHILESFGLIRVGGFTEAVAHFPVMSAVCVPLVVHIEAVVQFPNMGAVACQLLSLLRLNSQAPARSVADTRSHRGVWAMPS